MTMKTFKFIDVDHKWTPVGRKSINIKLRKLPHKHLYFPTMLSSFIDYVDLDIYQQIREDFLKGSFCYLANNDEYAFMLLFDLMNGYPDNAYDLDFVKLNDELNVLRRLSKTVDDFFNEYINNSEYKEYLRAEKKGVSKIFVTSNPNTFKFPYLSSIDYEPIDRSILPRDHKWKWAETSSPLSIEHIPQPLLYNAEKSITCHTSFEDLLKKLDNSDWKEYLDIRNSFLSGDYSDLTYNISVALHLMYDFIGGQVIAENTDREKLHNELWVLGQCCPAITESQCFCE